MVKAIDPLQLFSDFFLTHASILSVLGSPQINFVANKHYEGSRHSCFDFRIPLNINELVTFLMALVSVDFSVTAKVMRKISEFGYASGRNLANYYCPAVSLNQILLTRVRG